MAKRLEGIYGKSLDAVPEKDVERDGIQGWTDMDYDIESKEKIEAERFKREEEIRKEAQSVTEQIKALDGMTREELEKERDRLLSLESFGIATPIEVKFEIDRRIREAERLEQETTNKSVTERRPEYTGPLAGFMVHSEEGETKTADASRYTSNQVESTYSALAFASPAKREELEAELLGKFKTAKAKETEIGRIDKATHDLQELAQGHEIEIDKGDKDF